MNRALAVITGGTSGIGLAIARRLAHNTDLALIYGADSEKATRAVAELFGESGELRVKAYRANLTGTADCRQIIKQIREDFSGRTISKLINSAGRIRDQLFALADMETHELMIQEHLIVPMALSQLILPDMYRERFGRIVNIGSISARSARMGQTSYSAAKAGLEAFTRNLALEVAHRGITVNLVAPGMIESAMTKDMLAKLENPAQAVPVGFVGQPEDVAHLVEFLCSAKAHYITGTVIPVDGGRSLGPGHAQK